MNNLNIFCVTNKPLKNFESSNLKLVGVGKENFPKTYIIPDNLDNIFYKEEYYSELTFHYWYWKNQLDINDKNWFGFSQKRRHWIKSSSENFVRLFEKGFSMVESLNMFNLLFDSKYFFVIESNKCSA